MQIGCRSVAADPARARRASAPGLSRRERRAIGSGRARAHVSEPRMISRRASAGIPSVGIPGSSSQRVTDGPRAATRLDVGESQWPVDAATLVATSIPSSSSNPSTEPCNLDGLDAPGSISAPRSRLRALWTEWSVEVRVLSGALGKPRTGELFHAWPRSSGHPASWLLATRCGYARCASAITAVAGRHLAATPMAAAAPNGSNPMRPRASRLSCKSAWTMSAVRECAATVPLAVAALADVARSARGPRAEGAVAPA